MHRQNRQTLLVFCIFLCLLLAGGCSDPEEQPKHSTPQRVVSLAPSITETLFALGSGDKLVGVTRYCNFPAATDTLPKVGGFRDINLEKLAVLRPDMVFLQPEHEKVRLYCENNGIPYRTIQSRSLTAILHNFHKIADAMGVSEQGDSLVAEFQERFKTALQPSGDSTHKPRILLVVGRSNPGNKKIQQVFSTARGTLFDEIITAAGAQNAIQTSTPGFPVLSQEGIIAVAPDIIVDVVSTMTKTQCEEFLTDWNSLSTVPAVKNKSIFCINEEYATIPGPRIRLLLQDLQKIIRKSETLAAFPSKKEQ